MAKDTLEDMLRGIILRTHPGGDPPWGDLLDEAIAEIRQLFLSMLPEKSKCPLCAKSIDKAHYATTEDKMFCPNKKYLVDEWKSNIEFAQGYNQAIDDMLAGLSGEEQE